MVDLTLDGLPDKKQFQLSVHECGDISKPPASVGSRHCLIGKGESDGNGRFNGCFELFGKRVDGFIGRSMVVDFVDNNVASDQVN